MPCRTAVGKGGIGGEVMIIKTIDRREMIDDVEGNHEFVAWAKNEDASEWITNSYGATEAEARAALLVKLRNLRDELTALIEKDDK
jgi:hypothetical protein